MADEMNMRDEPTSPDESKNETQSSPRPSKLTLAPRIQDAIGQSLKAHYEDLVSAPVPDRFLVLLAELEAKEQSHER